jgi:hypothetical protein
VGGDQSVDLGKLKISDNHDSVVLGYLWAICYSTQKKFDDFELIQYVHTLGPENMQPKMPQNADLWEDARPPYDDAFEQGLLPTLRYDVLNQTLHLDGGVYTITARGIED